jgi:hypothetical protein
MLIASQICEPMNPAPPVTSTRAPANASPCNRFQSVLNGDGFVAFIMALFIE